VIQHIFNSALFCPLLHIVQIHSMSASSETPVSAAVQLWISCLADLQLLQDGLEADRPAAEAAVARIFNTMRIADQLPAALPATTWKDLILHHKVC